jgi:protein O-mannosyl-transferase
VSAKTKAKEKHKKKPANLRAAGQVNRLKLVETPPAIAGQSSLTQASSGQASLGQTFNSTPEGFQRQTQILITLSALLAIVTFAVYFRALQNPFVNYDDQGYVVENQNIQHGLTKATFRWALTATDATNWHPLTWLSHALDYQLYGLRPAGHHLTSVLLHVMSTVLLFLLLAKATGSTGKSLLVAALFGLHPFNVESVAWVSERKNVLCMFFMMLTLGAYGWYARRPRGDRYLVVAALFVLALAAKPMAVTLPFALLLVDFWPLQRVRSVAPPSEVFPVAQASFLRLMIEKLPLLLLAAAASFVTLIAQKAAVTSNEHVPLQVRLVNAAYAYTMYIVKTFWPTHLASFYPYEGSRLGVFYFLLCLAFLIGLSIWFWRERSHTYLVPAWCWFLGTLVPMIGVVQVGEQAMADRYAYLPLIGIFVIVVWGVADFAQSRKLNLRAFAIAAAAILAAFSFLTWRQIGVWHSSRDLWFHALASTRDNYMAEDYAGSALLLEHYEATGERRLDEAAMHFRNAVRINPNDAISHLNLGADLHERGQVREAIPEYQTVLALTQDEHLVMKSYVDLGAAYQQLGDYATADHYYRQAWKLEPNNNSILLKMGQLAMARRIQDLSYSAAEKPSPDAYWQLGQLQEAAGQLPEARKSYETALKMNPNFDEAKKALASVGSGNNSAQ